jgi:mRNA interferase HigB
MKVLVRKTVYYYIDKYPKAKKQLIIWHNEFSEMIFNNFNELKEVYENASVVNNNSVVFNMKGNNFRLVVSINFRQQTCYLVWFGTHVGYDKINDESIAFEANILNFIKK